MKITNEHLYHGAALTQVAEHPTFKAINELSPGGLRSGKAFRINADIGLYLKYCATKPKGPYKEFVFTFDAEGLNELQAIKALKYKLFISLICVRARHICCITYELLRELIAERKQEKGADEQSYTILVTALARKGFRIYVNVPGRRKTMIMERVVSRTGFPKILFLNP
jgi:hypothetical protein